MATPLGVGLVGAGAVTQAIHLPTLARLGDQFEVRQVYDVAPEVAERVAARVGARWTTELAEVLDDDTIDVVAICSPGPRHAEQVIAACEAGKRGVLCEKPFAESAEQAARIVAAATATGVPILVGAMHTFDPGWRAATQRWGDLPEKAHTIRSSIVLPPNPRFEDFATEVVGRPPGLFPAPAGVEARARAVQSFIMGLTIHNLPLIRSLLPHSDDIAVREARHLGPMGYDIVLTVGGKLVELHALMSQTWRPSWTLDLISDDHWVNTEFTPSYVQAGSATSTLFHRGGAVTLGPFDDNGYAGEWRTLGEIVRGETPAPPLQPLIDDLSFALALADAVADRIRTTVSEVPA